MLLKKIPNNNRKPSSFTAGPDDIHNMNCMSRVLKMFAVLLVGILLSGCATSFAERREVSRAMVRLAASKIDQGDTQTALVELARAAEENPRDPEIYYYKAAAYRQLGKADKALENVERAIRYGNKLGMEHPGMQSEAYNLKGVLLFETEQYDDAIEAFGNALKDDLYATPEDSLHNMAGVYIAQKNYDKALELLEDALRRNSYYALAWKTRADILIYMGRYDDAERSLNQAILIEGEYLDAHLALARLSKKLGNTAGARQELLEIIRIDSDGAAGFRPVAEALLNSLDEDAED